MKLHANMCISGLKHAQEILIIDISTSNMSFLQYLEVKRPYPTYISWKTPTTNRNPHLWWKYRIPRFHYKSSTDVGLKGDLGLLVMTRQLVVYILLLSDEWVPIVHPGVSLNTDRDYISLPSMPYWNLDWYLYVYYGCSLIHVPYIYHIIPTKYLH